MRSQQFFCGCLDLKLHQMLLRKKSYSYLKCKKLKPPQQLNFYTTRGREERKCDLGIRPQQTENSVSSKEIREKRKKDPDSLKYFFYNHIKLIVALTRRKW